MNNVYSHNFFRGSSAAPAMSPAPEHENFVSMVDEVAEPLGVRGATATILLIDDDQDHRVYFGHLLRNAGYTVLLASDAREGLKILCSRRIHLVICDLMMPEIDGNDFIHVVRESQRLENVPLIILSNGDKKQGMESIKLGADVFCEKKKANETLLAQVNSLLGVKSN